MAAVLLLAGACARVPDSGPVHVGRQVPAAGDLAEDDIRVLPPPPRPGMSRTALVTGFLRALVFSDNDYAIARSYLVAGTEWRPGAALTTYDENGLTVSRTGTKVSVRAPRVGSIDSHGNFQAAGGMVTRHFAVRRDSGEWRISGLAPGVLLSTVDADRSLQAASVYFLDRTGARVVPRQVLVHPDRPGLSTTLVQQLLAGPGSSLTGAAETAIPPGARLLGSVPIDDNGVAQVDLSGDIRALPATQLVRISAQLGWTLRQLGEVTAVELFADGSPVVAPGLPLRQSAAQWDAFNPETAPAGSGAIVVRDGAVRSLGYVVPVSLQGLRGVSAVSISRDGERVAVVRQVGGGDALLVGPRRGVLVRRVAAADISAVATDARGDFLVATSRGGFVVPPAGRITELRMTGAVPIRSVRSMAVSPDGARLAVVSATRRGESLVVGSLRTTKAGSALVHAHPTLPSQHRVRAVAWTSATQLVTTATAGASRVVIGSDYTGYQTHRITRAGLEGSPVTVAAVPQRAVLAETSVGVFRLADGSWTRISTTGTPTYPG